MSHHNAIENAKHLVDATSIGIWGAAMLELLPAFAAIVSIIWGVIRIYETSTVQRLLGRAHRRKDDPPKKNCKEEK